MALSNRDRIGGGFEILATALDKFLTEKIQVDANSTWIDVLETVDIQKGRSINHYSRTDPLCSLRFITDGVTGRYHNGWYPLNDYLRRSDDALASELRDTRNSWAHNSAFSADDTYRALDSMERLSKAMGDKEAAEEFAKRKNSVRVLQVKQSTEQARDLLVSVSGENLPAWRDLILPHPDVANGTFNPSGFAADLHTVANPTQVAVSDKVSASSEYTDPQQFFERTYITEGLRDLLPKALRRLSGDASASPVINLQTNFGGGKTHSMLAVWHLFGGLDEQKLPQDMQTLLAGQEIPQKVRRVALVGTNLSASGKMFMPDGTVVNTMWGHLAWQIGGKEGYEIVKDDDLNGTNPGAKLRLLFERFGPTLILIDEWVAYARQLVGNNVRAGGTLSTQQSFAQALGEAVASTSNCMLLVSIPASAEMQPGSYIDDQVDDEEIGGADGREALLALLQVINRQAEQWRPAGSTESFEIVRRRIFEEIPDESQAKIEAIAQVMQRFYEKNAERFPHDASRADYITKIARCYPVHPELFDRLYEDWATLPKFQRTRGVLRLMSIIVHNVWKSSDSAPLITPASIPLQHPAVANELAQYLEDDWKSVISVDVDGPVPHGIDEENPLFGARHVATRLARTVFLGSAPRAKNSGLDERFINLGTALPGDKIGNFHSALSALGSKSSHFYEADGRYWFDTSANITSEVRQREESLLQDNLFEEIENRLKKEAKSWSQSKGSSIVVIAAPQSGADVLDIEDTRLVIIPPSVTEGPSEGAKEYVINTTSHIGESKARTFKNTVVYLAADERRLSELLDSVRKFLAWSSVYDDEEKLDLTSSQAAQAAQNADKWNTTVNDRLVDAYQWLLIPEDATDEDKAAQRYIGVSKHKITGGQSIIGRAEDKLITLGKLNTTYAANVLLLAISRKLNQQWVEAGYISLGYLWDIHTKYLYMPRLLNRKVLEQGIRGANFTEKLDAEYPFAFAESTSETQDGITFENLRWPSHGTLPQGSVLPDSLLLVNPTFANKQFELEAAKLAQNAEAASSRATSSSDSAASYDDSESFNFPTENKQGASTSSAAVKEGDKATKYFGTFKLPIASATADFLRIDDEILSHYRELAKKGAQVSVTVDVQVVHDGGIPDSIQTMTKESTQEIPGSTAGFE